MDFYLVCFHSKQRNRTFFPISFCIMSDDLLSAYITYLSLALQGRRIKKKKRERSL